MASTLTKPRLVYFSSRGLAEFARILLAETATDYDDVGFGSFEPGVVPPLFSQLKADGLLMFDQVPLWEEPNGLRLVQSAAIVRHLARTKGLYGKSENEAAIADALWEYLVDVRNSVSQVVRSDPSQREEKKKNLLEVELPKVLTRLEAILKKNGNDLLVGSQVTYADLLWWYWLENYVDQGLGDLAAFPHVAKFKAAIEARPNIAKYRANPARYPVQYLFPRYVLNAYPGNINALKAQIAGEFGGIKIDYPTTFKMGVDNKTPEFLKKFPLGQVPTLDSPDGPIFESNAIAKYVTRKGQDKGLYGANEYEASQIDQWIEVVRSKLEDDMWTLIGPLFRADSFNQEKHDAARGNVAKTFAILDKAVEGKEFFVGKRVTLADIVLFVSLKPSLTMCFNQDFVKPFPNLIAWAKRCAALPQFKAHIPDFVLCEKELAPGALAR